MRDFEKAPVQRAGLMRILTVAKRLLATEREAECFAQPGRFADVDIFDRIVEARARLRDRFLKRVKVHHDKIDRLDPMLKHLALMALIAAPREDSSVDFRMQRLYPPVQHLGRA